MVFLALGQIEIWIKKIQPQCLILNKIGSQELAIKWARELANSLLGEQELNAELINKYEQGK